MKALFVHDHVFLSNETKVYSDKLNYTVWTRYLRHCGELTVFARCRHVDVIPKNIPISNGSSVQFVRGNSISSFRSYFGGRAIEKKTLKRQVMESDFVIARLPSEFGAMAVSLARELHKPTIIEAVGCAKDSFWFHGGIVAKLYSFIAFRRMRQSISRANYVIFVTQHYLQQRYLTDKNCLVAEISNVSLGSVSKEVLTGRVARIKAEKRFVTLGVIGSMKTRYKGIDIAIKALSVLIRSEIMPSYRLRVLGDGNTGFYLALAKQLGVDDLISFDGILPTGDPVFGWLDGIDIYLQPSFTEGMPRALMEAMSRGCPAIGSRVGGIPELLDDEFTFKPGRVSQLSRLITKLKNVEIATAQAERNYAVADSYQYEKLERRRDKFFEDFKKQQRLA